MLSGTTILPRANLHARRRCATCSSMKVCPHAFWQEAGLPVSQDSDRAIAHFFIKPSDLGK